MSAWKHCTFQLQLKLLLVCENIIRDLLLIHKSFGDNLSRACKPWLNEPQQYRVIRNYFNLTYRYTINSCRDFYRLIYNLRFVSSKIQTFNIKSFICRLNLKRRCVSNRFLLATVTTNNDFFVGFFHSFHTAILFANCSGNTKYSDLSIQC